VNSNTTNATATPTSIMQRQMLAMRTLRLFWYMTYKLCRWSAMYSQSFGHAVYAPKLHDN